ncbi:tyrosine-type recombinase/integrase [Azospirillum isscasi]|uniref:Tyrosine-type recombinase/integrase n=1 Tax=Azospirillum isscasi TaxID=3053926 RepID=A0ABU0WLX7_9PROT|nr:tyrosine-type recombinase/integrase [Azospirillum isscasi]MDQ2104569.1 tyrosine-type recombinase/integrase [Azospirillum isscasi]
MTVFKRDGSEFWWIEFQYKGERYRRSSESTSKRKAEEMERKWREELRATALLGKIPELAWEDAIDRYFETVVKPRGNKSAAKRDLYVLNALKLELGAATHISALTAPVIVEYRDKLLSAGKAPATVNRYLAIIKAILRKAHTEWGALAVLPSFRLLKLNNERYRWLTDDEEDRLLIHCPVHLRDLCTFLIDTGARLSEATTLTWANVDMKRHPRPLVKFMDTKSGKPRSVPLTKRVEEMFQRLHASKPEREERVFLYRPLGNDVSGARSHRIRC